MILKGPKCRPMREVGFSKGKARLAMEMLQNKVVCSLVCDSKALSCVWQCIELGERLVAAEASCDCSSEPTFRVM